MAAFPADVSGGTRPGPMPSGLGAPFNADDLRTKGFFGRLAQWLVDNPQWLLGLLRRFWPILYVPLLSKWAIVTRWDDVQEVLANDEIFEVPFGPKVIALNGGPNFLLGMKADRTYWRYQQQVMQAFRLDDIKRVVAPQSWQFASRIIEGANGRLDAIQDLITRVPTLLCENYYGVEIAPAQRVEFAQWTIAMSTYMFGDPNDDPTIERVALAAGNLIRPLVDNSIKKAHAAQASPGAAPGTVLRRLIDMRQNGAGDLTDEIIRTYLIGMIAGFVPTNTMAAGHMLDMLFRRPDFMAQTQAAALSGDDDLLKGCLFEVMRFRPLNPGPFRRCAQNYRIAKGTSRARTIRAGASMLVSTQSAMFDERHVQQPKDFNPRRPATDYMLFGHGLHWCVGAFIAEAQITQTLKALLIRNRLRRAPGRDGQLKLLGPFPEHLVVEFS